MRAVSYGGRGTLSVAARDNERPGRGQVQIAVSYVGICGTDLHLFHGDLDDRAAPGRIIGHEMSGTVADIGSGVAGWETGEKVTVIPVQSCLRCSACRQGHLHLCDRLIFLGIDSDDAMREQWNVPAGNLVRLPQSMDLRTAALVEPTAVAVHDVGRSAIRSEETALVVGGGPIGLLVAAVAGARGADVLVLEPDPFRRSVIQRLGVRVLDAGSDAVQREILQWTDGAGPAVAFEVSGSQEGMDTAVGCLAVRGRLVVVAIHTKRRAVDLHRFFWRELTMVGARLYERRDFEEAVRLIQSGALPVADLITRCEPMHRAQDAVLALDSGQGVMKVLVDCQASAE